MKRTEHTQKWLDALRSGWYSQTCGVLRNETGYCCLGVGAVVAGLPLEETLDGYCVIRDALGLTDIEKANLTVMNDGSNATFPEIADAIEQMLDGN